MRFQIVALSLFSLCFAALRAEDPKLKEETASAEILLTRPKDSAFIKILASTREQLNVQPAFTWEQVDEKIDTWFSKEKTRSSEEYNKHAEDWEKLSEQSKTNARKTLAPIELAWQNSGTKAADAFVISEKAFYELKPSILIQGTYRFHEGQRDISAVKNAWELKEVTWRNTAGINGADIYDSGDVVLKAADIDLAMFSLRCEWSVSLEASVDPTPLIPTAIGSINSPSIRAWIIPSFIGKTNRKISLTWQDMDKNSIKSGVVGLKISVDSKISSKSEIGMSGRYELLDAEATMPELHAGQNVPTS